MSDPLSRRDFLKRSSAAGAALATTDLLSLSLLRPAHAKLSPLEYYPDRGWERIYRNVYASDDSYVFMCTPNCTHNCYLEAFVKNGVVTRCGPTQKYHLGTDLYGTKASQRWDPRHCNKGLAIVRRFSGDRRVKAPMVRRGFREWVERGFPRDQDGLPPAELFRRGQVRRAAPDSEHPRGWEGYSRRWAPCRTGRRTAARSCGSARGSRWGWRGPSGGLICPLGETAHTAESAQEAWLTGYRLADTAGFYRTFGVEVKPGASATMRART